MNKKLLVLCLLLNSILMSSGQSSTSNAIPSTTPAIANSYFTTTVNWFITSSYSLNILKIERSETEMKCKFEYNQIGLGFSVDINMILQLKMNWVDSNNNYSYYTTQYYNTQGTNSLYNSTIYYDSAKSLFYSSMPLLEWKKHINKEVYMIRFALKLKLNYFN
jgi:hypothetical protein